MSVDVKSGVYDAPAIAAIVFEFLNNGNTTPVVIVENLDDAASAAIRFQESDNGVDFTDIADTAATVLPGGENVLTLTQSNRARIALHAGGNVKLLVTIVRTVKGSPTTVGAA